MSQEQRDCDELWVFASGQASPTADQRVEVVTGVELFEQRLKQSTRPTETSRGVYEHS